jgi:FlaA1/EpsC-like NDP-sugar epimerase
MLNYLQVISKPLLALPRIVKRILVLSIDASLCVLTVSIAFYLRLGEWVPISDNTIWMPIVAVAVSLFISIPIFIVSGFYRAIFRYSGWSALTTISKAIGIYALIYSTIFTIYGISGVPRTIGLIQPLLLLLAIGATRSIARYWLGDIYQTQIVRNALPKVLVYGAGAAGRQLAAALANSHEMKVVGFLDDDKRLHGQFLNGLRIYVPNDLVDLVLPLNISDVLLAIPSASRKRRNEILTQILKAKVSVRTLPSVTELAQGKVTTSDLRDLDIDDLLGREPVPPDVKLLSKTIINKTVLITGAGGSIGSEICRQVILSHPKCLLLIDQNEYALYSIHQELINKIESTSIQIIPLLASVCDKKRVMYILSAWKPDTIYHAAAYKHVPLVEHNPVEGIRNNVFGTITLANAAIEFNIKNFVLISTDKAVRPTNIMGATKRIAEMALQALSSKLKNEPKHHSESPLEQNTIFSIVRFGNVLGSSGSVVPLFRQQVKDGGPITLTHQSITRYFMSIPEAAQLVLQAAALGHGGDLFILDMGEPVKIIDLAKRVIELSGLLVKNTENPNGDIEIKITGLRPGEKLYEELLIGDNPIRTTQPKIMRAHEEFLEWDVLENKLNNLSNALENNDVEEIIRILKDIVKEYSGIKNTVDWVTLESMKSQSI